MKYIQLGTENQKKTYELTKKTGDYVNHISTVILCGGKSRRMGTDKAALLFHGETFLSHLVKELVSCGEVLISIGADGPSDEVKRIVQMEYMPGNVYGENVDDLIFEENQSQKEKSFIEENVLLEAAKKTEANTEGKKGTKADNRIITKRIHGQIKLVQDRYEACGPMAGIYAALSACKNEILFAVACDMPFADLEIAKILLPYMNDDIDAVIPTELDGRRHPLCALYHKNCAAAFDTMLKSGNYCMNHLLSKLRVCYVASDCLNGKLNNINTQMEYNRMRSTAKETSSMESQDAWKIKQNRYGIPIFSVVAYSGTGKTTFLEKLIPALKRRNLSVGVVKHDAHAFEIDREGKDSWRLTKAGADVTALLSAERAVLMENRSVAMEVLLDQIRDVDVILTEGYKTGDFPKIMLYREAAGKPFAALPKDCIAAASDVPLPTYSRVYRLDDAEGIANLLCKILGKR